MVYIHSLLRFLLLSQTLPIAILQIILFSIVHVFNEIGWLVLGEESKERAELQQELLVGMMAIE